MGGIVCMQSKILGDFVKCMTFHKEFVTDSRIGYSFDWVSNSLLRTLDSPLPLD